MKPTLPEDRELEDEMSSEVAERYRAGAQEEPSTRVDAAILAAARRNVEPQRQRRNWQMPVSIAATFVLGVSLVLIMRDNEPPLPSLDRPAADEAKLAKSAPPQLAMEADSKPRADLGRADRPSRERSARPDRESIARDQVAAKLENGVRDQAASGASTQSAPAPAAPAIVGQVKPAELELAESNDVSSRTKAQTAADAVLESRVSAQTMRKEGRAAPSVQPQDWLRKIEDLMRDGKEADAREQLLNFRKQFPEYALSPRLQALLPPDQR